MREILTIIAGCLVAVLLAALAAPPFVDWDGRRASIDERLSARFGGTVRTEGPVSLRLLPAPRLTVGALRATRPGLDVAANAVQLELSPTALMRGRFVFTEAALDRPRIVATPDRFGIVDDDPGRVGFDRLVLSDARLEIAGAAPLVIEHVDLSVAADSLAGPFRGSGATRGPQPATFSFSTGPIADGRMRGKIALDAAASHAEAEGDLTLDAGAPAFSGKANASGGTGANGPRWRAGFALQANATEARADNLDVRLGEEDNGLGASGEATLSRDGLAMNLVGRNLDLDRLHRAFPEWPSAAPAMSNDMRVKIALAADSATLGGETVAAPRAQLDFAAGAEPRLMLDAEPPGRSRLHYDGAIAFAPDLRLHGALRLSSRDPGAFGRWIAPAAPELAHALAASPFTQVDVSADVTTQGRAFEAKVADARLDRSTFAGVVKFQPSRDGLRARLEATIRSPALDIDGLPEFQTPVAGNVDFLIDLDAQTARIARVGAAAADTGRIRMRLARYGAGLSLENIAIENLGGATLTGGGRLDRSGGRLDLQLDAARLGDLARLAERIAPGGATAAFAARAGALSPAHLVVALEAQDGALSRMDVSGEAGGTKIGANLTPAASGALRFSMKADAADFAALAGQAGIAALPIKGTGAGHVEAQGEGAIGQPMKTKAQMLLAGVRASFDGDVTLAFDRAAAAGRLSVTTADATPLVQMLGLGAGDLARRIPLDANARLDISPARLAFDDISGALAGARVSGRLAHAAQGVLSGALAFDTLSAPFLASLVLGPAQPAAAGAPWSQIRFAPSLFDPPRADIAISARQVDLGIATAGDARADIAFSPGGLDAKNIEMRIGGASLAGDVALRREGAAALVRANIRATDLPVEAPPFAARVSGALALAGAGASAAELVASLAGEGRATFDAARIARAAPRGLADALVALDREDAPVSRDAVAQALARAFDRGDLTLATTKTDIAVAAGRVSLSPVAAESGDAAMRIDGGLDLRSMRLEFRQHLRAPPPKDWTGAPPSVDLLWSGPPQTMQRTIQADGLVAALAERAIARETARNAALESDIRERSFFNRRLKFDRRLDAERRAAEARRKAEEAARAEQARIERERGEAERAERARLERDMRVLAPSPAERVEPPARPAPRNPSAFTPAPRGAPPDPSTAGRY